MNCRNMHVRKMHGAVSGSVQKTSSSANYLCYGSSYYSSNTFSSFMQLYTRRGYAHMQQFCKYVIALARYQSYREDLQLLSYFIFRNAQIHGLTTRLQKPYETSRIHRPSFFSFQWVSNTYVDIWEMVGARCSWFKASVGYSLHEIAVLVAWSAWTNNYDFTFRNVWPCGRNSKVEPLWCVHQEHKKWRC